MSIEQKELESSISKLAKLLEERRKLRKELGLRPMEGTVALQVAIGPRGNVRKNVRKRVAQALREYREFAVRAVNHDGFRESWAMAAGSETTVFLNFGFEELEAQLLEAVARYVSHEKSFPEPTVNRSNGDLMDKPAIDVPEDWKYCFISGMRIAGILAQHFPSSETGFDIRTTVDGTELYVVDDSIHPMVRQQKAWELLRQLQLHLSPDNQPVFLEESKSETEQDKELMDFIDSLPLQIPVNELSFEAASQGLHASALDSAVQKLVQKCSEQGRVLTQSVLSALTLRFMNDEVFMQEFSNELRAVYPALTSDRLQSALWSAAVNGVSIASLSELLRSDFTDTALHRSSMHVEAESLSGLEASTKFFISMAPLIEQIKRNQLKSGGVMSPQFLEMMSEAMPAIHGEIIDRMKDPELAVSHLKGRLNGFVNALKALDPKMDDSTLKTYAVQEMQRVVLNVFSPFANAICAEISAQMRLSPQTSNEIVLQEFVGLYIDSM